MISIFSIIVNDIDYINHSLLYKQKEIDFKQHNRL